MKKSPNYFSPNYFSKDIVSGFPLEDLGSLGQLVIKRKYPIYLFLAFCLNLVAAPAVFAANADSFTRFQAYALGLLGIATVSFSIYLFAVMFQPEKF
ncbi:MULTISPECIES: potassium-transporting ATPase subunit F [Pseudanabaena]|uniref:K+transporting ATPase F subunit n=2 Tax=Pseudanabaena TaxID=1152 RepID=L8MVU2_9CYAN|nr:MULTISPECIES: potassium-transporting ATPase subunit F [Pseudanabaena]ELS32082.1 K+transporting ATPase F subunit [Pseudanabaena biceps PCC 7429]MDG3495670.1 potassium-transporting ATPase subunit F [Pseudanabaena catenata USMAC16]